MWQAINYCIFFAEIFDGELNLAVGGLSSQLPN